MEEVRQKTGITDAQLAEVAGQDVVNRGPSTNIALFTHDVYQYLKHSALRETMDTGVSDAMTADAEAIVVAHSLGTSHNLLRQQGHLRGRRVPLFVTAGSSLEVTEIRKMLRNSAPIRSPQWVSNWLNAMDERDVVALYPLDTRHFPLNPTNPVIENKRSARNGTSNRHGIAGYLDDMEVAERIYDALIS
jgi:hypothetical protein